MTFTFPPLRIVIGQNLSLAHYIKFSDVPSVYRFIEAMLISTGFSPKTDLARTYLEEVFRFPLEAIARSAVLNFKFRPSLMALALYSLFLETSGSPFWFDITIGLQRLLKVIFFSLVIWSGN